jgi:hypothetical protein
MTIEASSSGINRYAPLTLRGRYFRGFAMFPHLQVTVSPDGYRRRTRTPFAEKLFQTLFNDDIRHMREITGMYIRGIITLFPHNNFDCLLMVPPPVSRRDYAPAVRLINEISMKSGILSLQYAIRQVPVRPDEKRGEFTFVSETVSGIYAGKHALVITDFYRSGRSLNALATFLAEKGKTASISILAGTMVQKELPVQ